MRLLLCDSLVANCNTSLGPQGCLWFDILIPSGLLPSLFDTSDVSPASFHLIRTS